MSTNTALSTSGSLALGQAVTFTATVNPLTLPSPQGGEGAPTGTMSFVDAGTTLAAGVTLDGSGRATFSTTSLALGGHVIAAIYQGDPDFVGSTSAKLANFVFSSASPHSFVTSANADGSVTTQATGDTATTVVSLASDGLLGLIVNNSSVTLAPINVTVSDWGDGSDPSTGAAQLLNLTNSDTQAAPGDQFGVLGTHAYASPGTYTVSGSFSGGLSGSWTAVVVVNQAGTTTTVSSSQSPGVFGIGVTFTASVSDLMPSGLATGTVTFFDGSTSIGAGTLASDSTATFSTSALAVGNHAISGTYGGDANFTGSTSIALGEQILSHASVSIASTATALTSSQAVTFTATVAADDPNAGTPSGTVTFLDGKTVLAAGITADVYGQATFSTAALASGSHMVTASYSGDSTFGAGVSPGIQIDVNVVATGTALTLSPTSTVYGQPVTLAVQVFGLSNGFVPSGRVTFSDGGTPIGTATLIPASTGPASPSTLYLPPMNDEGVATLTITGLAAGSHTITAIYPGDINFAASTSAAVTERVSQTASTTTVFSSPGESVYGSAVTFIAYISPTDGGNNPTGTVTFMEGSTTLAAGVPVDDFAEATFSTASLSAGYHVISAFYSGDTNFQVGSGDDSAAPHLVDQDTSLVDLGSSANPTIFGQGLTFTASVSAETSSQTPTGAVDFLDGGALLAEVPLVSGQATYSTSGLTAGSHTIGAYYGGDGNLLAGSTDDSYTPQVVDQGDTATALTTSASSTVHGQTLTFTASVSDTAPAAGTATGTVTFFDGNTTLAIRALNDTAQATFSTLALSTSVHSISAVYNGDGNFNSSTSNSYGGTVNQAASAVTVASSPGAPVFGQAVIFTATVSAQSPGTGTATGTVSFLEGTTTLASGVALSAGQATFSTTGLAVGTHTVSVSYGGDGNFLSSSGDDSGSPQIVNQATSSTLISPPSSLSVFGQVVSFTATVTAVAPGAGTPSGTVSFLEGSTVLGSGNLDGTGTATFSTAVLTVGAHTVTASYVGDGNFHASSGDDSASPQVVAPASSSTAVTSAANPSVFGQTVTFTATISAQSPSSATPTGTVDFLEGSTTVAPGVVLSGGQATFTTAGLAVGSHTVSVNYGGDSGFFGSSGDDSASPQSVSKDSSSTVVTSIANPSAFGQAVTFTATISAQAPGAGTPGGTVSFVEGNTALASGVALSAGQATFSTAGLTVGSHTVTASYGGNGNFLGSSGSDSASPQAVNQSSSSTAVTSVSNPSVFGQAVTFTATVSAVAPGAGTPGGTVSFLEGSTALATGVALSAGQATFATGTLGLGTHTITASYGGNGSFVASSGSDAGSPQTVNQASSSTALTSASNPSAWGQVVTFTATVSAVSPGAGTPSGTLTFKEGSATLAPNVTLNGSGQATFTTSSLTVNTHTITASYSGDGNFVSSTGNDSAAPQVVNKASSGVAVSSATNPSVFGQTVTFTATISAVAPGVGTPTGTVTFKEGAATLMSGVALNGSAQATFSIASLSVASHTITVSYAGDGNFQSSSGDDSASPQVVNKAASSVAVISAANPSVYGQAVIFTATVSAVSPGAGTPSGTVTFKEGTTVLAATVALGSAQATFSISSLSVSTHTITATYNGDGNFLTSTGSASPQVVNKASSSTTVGSSPNSSVWGQVMTFTATVSAVSPGAGTPSGTVTFKEGSTTLANTVALNGSAQATFSTSTLSVTTHTITATYNGDGNFLTSSGSDSGTPQVVNKASSSTAVSSSPNSSVWGQAMTFTATVSTVSPGAGTPSGTVTFKEGSTTLANTVALNGSSQATFSTSSLSVATHTITAAYNGDGNFLTSSGSDSGTPPVVNKASSTTTVSSSPNSSVWGQVVTFTATVSAFSPGAGTPSGTITFKEGSTTLANTVALNGSAQATFSTSSLSVATHTITAAYNGDGNFLTSTGSDSASPQVVNKASSSTTVSSSPNSSVYGQVVTFTATVSAVSPGAGTPSGTVTFKEGTTTLANTVALNGSALATFTTSSLSVATHTITAAYNGDGNFLTSSGSDSGTPQAVNQDSSSTGVTASANPAVWGQIVIFSATVSAVAPGAGTPTGTVTFKEGSTTLASGVALSGGLATYVTSTLSIATHTITASYSGDSSFTASSGSDSSAPEVVNKSSTSTVLSAYNPQQVLVSALRAPSNYIVGTGGGGTTLTFTAVVSAVAPGGGTPSGTVTFKMGSTTLSSGTLDDTGTATLVVSGLSGTHTFTASYNGDSYFITSTSANLIDAAPSGDGIAYTPAQIRSAYGIDNLSLDGSGQTIAIVEAYADPAIYQALDTFDAQFGLTASGATLYDQYGPASSFLSVVNQSDQATPLPTTDPTGAGNANWEMEMALDTEWVHAMAPGAHLVVVEANSQSLADLMASVATAGSQPGVSVVSMSWGFPEGQSVLAQDEAMYDSYLTRPGVTFVASTGDYGTADPEYPAFSPNVLAVGGTTLNLNSAGSYQSETGWGYYLGDSGLFVGSGGGLSQFEPEPTYQQGVQATGSRTTPDVSFVADPATGAWIADPYNLGPTSPFEVVGGTSLSAPSWAGLVALVNQGRADAGQPALNSASPTETQQALYSLSQSDYHVIASGTNGGYNAAPGYNLVTGLGTPVANALVPDLVAGNYPATGQVAPISSTLNANPGWSGWGGGSFNAMHVFGAVTDRGQKSEVRGQKSEVRGRRSEVRGQESEVGRQRSEVRDQKWRGRFGRFRIGACALLDTTGRESRRGGRGVGGGAAGIASTGRGGGVRRERERSPVYRL